MTLDDIARIRIQNLGISVYDNRLSIPQFIAADKLLHWMGAIQGQDYPGSKWSLGLRLPGNTESDIDKAIASGKIIRTWAMRGTLHLMAADDVRNTLAVVSDRGLAVNKGRFSQLGLNEKLFKKSREILKKELEGGRQLTKAELTEIWQKAGISKHKEAPMFLIFQASLAGIICHGPKRKSEYTFVLLDEWAPGPEIHDRGVALAKLAVQYFQSHAPATLNDFAWWTGLALKDCRAGMDMIKSKLIKQPVDGIDYWLPENQSEVPINTNQVYLLPGFDELILGYKNRNAVIDTAGFKKISGFGNGLFSGTIVIDAKVAGMWKRRIEKGRVIVKIAPFARFSKAAQTQINSGFKNYGVFLDMPVSIE